MVGLGESLMEQGRAWRWGVLVAFGGSTLLQLGGCGSLLGETFVRILFDLAFIPINTAIQQALVGGPPV